MSEWESHRNMWLKMPSYVPVEKCTLLIADQNWIDGDSYHWYWA